MLNLIKAYADQIKIESRPRNFFYISDLGKCERQTIYRFTDLPKKEISPFQIDMMNEGTEKHDKVYEYWMKSDLAIIATELSLNPWLPPAWHGRTDVLAQEEDSSFAIIDVKSLRANAFKYELPKSDHKLPLLGYILGATKMLGAIPRAYLYYCDRDGSNTPQQYYFDFTPKDLDTIAEIMTTYELNLELYQTEGILPPFLTPLPKKIKGKMVMCVPWQCDYCDYEGVTCRIKEDLL